jgi:hypothetical protein
VVKDFRPSVFQMVNKWLSKGISRKRCENISITI